MPATNGAEKITKGLMTESLEIKGLRKISRVVGLVVKGIYNFDIDIFKIIDISGNQTKVVQFGGCGNNRIGQLNAVLFPYFNNFISNFLINKLHLKQVCQFFYKNLFLIILKLKPQNFHIRNNRDE